MGSKLSRDEIDKYFNEIFGKDENSKYKSLKFQDSVGDRVYTGKADEELNVEEIVFLKEKLDHFWEIFGKFTTNDIEALNIVSKLLKISFNELVFYTSKLENNLLYISIPLRGGGSIIIDSITKEYLFSVSYYDFDEHLEKFLNGERTPQI